MKEEKPKDEEMQKTNKNITKKQKKNKRGNKKKWDKIETKFLQSPQKIRGRKIPHFVELGKTNLLNHPYTSQVDFTKFLGPDY